MKKTILVAEDEAALQKTLTAFLIKEGYEVIQALDGEIAVRLAEDKKPDLILLDLILPKKNGFEVLSQVKENESTKSIPVIVLTNLEGSQDVEKALSLGATTYLVKTSYSLDDVISKIKNIIGE